MAGALPARHSAWALREATITRAENSRQETAGNHPLALTFQNTSASAFASAFVPAQLPPRLRLRPRPDYLGATAPISGRSRKSRLRPGQKRGRNAVAGARLPGARAEGGAAASPRLGSRCGGSAEPGARATAGGGDGGSAAWARAAPLLPLRAGSGAWQGQRRACIRDLGAPGWSGTCGTWEPRSAKAESAGPVIRGEERPPPPPPRPTDFRSPALPLPAQPQVASAAEAKGSSAQDS